MKKRPRVSGAYDSDRGNHLAIKLKYCDPTLRSTCKDHKKVKEWIRGKYVVVVENQWTFRSESYADKRLSATSNMHWIPLFSNVKEEWSRKVQVSDIYFDDNWYMITGVVGQENSRFFTVSENALRAFEFEDNSHFLLRYEMSDSLIEYQRSVYSALDWLGDIGGLSEAIKAIFILILFFL